MRHIRGLSATMLLLSVLIAGVSPVEAAPEGRSEAPEGQMTWAVHTTLVPSWFDPAEMTLGAAFMTLYAIHDAVVKAIPGKSMAPSLAESWSASPDGLVYEFVLRKGK
jgi:ABC-type transport system substrate-binding protein